MTQLPNAKNVFDFVIDSRNKQIVLTAFIYVKFMK